MLQEVLLVPVRLSCCCCSQVLVVAVRAQPGGSTAGRQRALGNDERSSTISRRYRVLIGASAAIGIVLSMWGMTVMAKAMSATGSAPEC